MVRRPGEFELIERYFAPLAGEGGLGLRDDAANLVLPQDQTLVVTQDAIAEGVHFLPTDSPDLIARKALRVNLSDLAAKGAEPFSFSLALGLGETWDEDWIARFSEGLGEDCREYAVTLSGGDTFRTRAGFVISITALGMVPAGKFIARAGASGGDRLYVTGTIGDAALGLRVLQDRLDAGGEANAFLTRRYRIPQPRLGMREILRDCAAAAMDVSDGLVGDLEKLAGASGCSATIEAGRVPLSEAAGAVVAAESKSLETVLTGGDDYEILLAVNPSNVPGFERRAAGLGFPVTPIGTMGAGQGVTVIDESGIDMELTSTGYNHTETS